MAPRPSVIATDRIRRARPGAGFTLIEVLVALAVIAIGLLAVLAVAARGTHVSESLQQRNFASWIAQNELARMHLAAKWPDLGESNDEVDFAHQKWRWDAQVEKTPDPGLRRVTITVAVADKPEDTITQLIGFIGKPPPKPVAPPLAGEAPGGAGKRPPSNQSPGKGS